MKFTLNKLLFLSFAVGFSVMVVELTATRILAPILGSTIYTWTSVIGVVLLGSSIGNFYGGKIIDKNNNPTIIANYLIYSAGFILFIVPIARTFDYLFITFPSLLISNLLASLLLFLLPAFLLGNIYPMLAKQYLVNDKSIGKGTGNLSAFGALGSIGGTFLTGYFFVGYLGTSLTLIIISFVLLLCGIFIDCNKRKAILLIVVYVSLAIFSTNFEKIFKNDSVVYKSDSDYYEVKVEDKHLSNLGKVRILFLDAGSNDIKSQEGKKFDSIIDFYPTFTVFNDNIKDIVVLGGGSMEIPDNLKRFYPQSKITTIEIDPKVTAVAKKFFDADEENIRNTVSTDGRVFLLKSNDKYDLIFSDAFNSFLSVPWYLATQEFFDLSKQKLNKNGVFAMNIVSATEGDNAKIYDSVLSTFSTVYNNYYVFAYGDDPKSIQNILLVGLNSNGHLPNEFIREHISKVQDNDKIANKLIDIKKRNGIILTDNFAPLEKLSISSINSHFQAYSRYFELGM